MPFVQIALCILIWSSKKQSWVRSQYPSTLWNLRGGRLKNLFKNPETP
jgi:hypothetical protein